MASNMVKQVGAAVLERLPANVRLSICLRLLNECVNNTDLIKARELLSHLEPQVLRLEDRVRWLASPAGFVPGYEGEAERSRLEYSVMRDERPWQRTRFQRLDIPGMITDEEIRYYHWVASFYSGDHEVVELGPWLGHSTVHLARALEPKLRSKNKQLHVYDDFVWRPGWMNQHMRAGDPSVPPAHESFEYLFRHFTADVASLIDVQRGKIADYDGNESLPPINWCGKAIELLVVDCGRTVKANQAWFDLLSPFFIPNRTLIVMQDWRLHRERPRKPYNQTWHFTESNPRLELVHEIVDGGIATFLFR
jgi:hypothetical protein